MKKIIKKFVLALVVVFAFGSVFGCSSSAGENNNDKTVLYINHYLGGVGNEWLLKIKKDFESEYADYKGQGNKVGVHLEINDQKTDGEGLFSDIPNSSDEIFFTDKSKYYDMVAQEYVLDISDVYTNVNSDNKTIESKLNEQQKEYYKVNGKYYALPHYESFGGITYNVDIFDEYSLYFKKGGCPSEYSAFIQENNSNKVSGAFSSYKYTDLSGERSAGPDGIYNTFDDGLPATYDEFFVLCDYMTDVASVTPFIWSGEFGKAYVNYLFKGLHADYEGYDQIKLTYDFDGTATHLVDNITNGVVNLKPETKISNSNGYLMFSSAGIYHAYNFVEKILSRTAYYSSNLNSNAHTHTQAQIDYVLSQFDTRFNKDGKPIAMLIEGNYWENEARDYGTLKKVTNYNKNVKDLRYAYLPLPKVSEEQIGEKMTICEAQGNIAFINKNIAPEKIDIAKKLLMYCYSDEKLQEFTSITGVTRGLNYEMSSEQMTNLSYYSKSLINIKKTADLVYLISGNPVYTENQTFFAGKTFSTMEYEYVLEGFKDYNKTALEIFEGTKSKFSQQRWETNFSKYFN